MRESMARTLPLLLLLAVAAPAGADWLVTRAGGRVETQGPWQVKGKLVVFKTPNGTLSSLRLADVDLAVSENATAEAKAAEDEKAKAAASEPAKPERKKSVRSLTDADFSRKPPPGADTEGAEGGADNKGGADGKAPAKPGSAANKGRVEVSSWSQARRTEGDGIDLFGTLQNSGDEMATDIVVKVQLFNEAKESIGTAEAVLAMSSIPGGGTTSFRVPFSGVFAFTQAEFKVTSRTMTMAPAPKGDGDGKPPQP
jgi:hypothetical protein